MRHVGRPTGGPHGTGKDPERPGPGYETILDALPDAVLVHDARTGLILEVNDGCVRMFGYRAEELEGMGVDAISAVEEGYTLPLARERLCEARRQGRGTFPWRSKRSDGTVFPTEVRLLPLGTGEGARILAVVRDMSDLEEAQARAHASEERIRLAFEGSNDGLWDVDMVTGAAYMSPRGLEILGYDPGDPPAALGSWRNMVHPGDMERTVQDLDAYLEGRVALFETEQRLRTRDGDWKWILVRGKVIGRAPDGTALRMAGTHTDISRRKAAEEALARITRLYAALSQVNQSVIRVQSREELFACICRDLVEHGGFFAAWVGVPEPAACRLLPAGQYGKRPDFLQGVQVSYDGGRPEGRGTMGRAFREDRHVVCNDFFNDPASLAWRETARNLDFKAAASFPIHGEDGSIEGILCIYARERDYFREQEIALLKEVCEDVRFALAHLAREERRRAAEAEKDHLLAFNRKLIQGSPLGMCLYDGESGRCVLFNRAAAEVLDASREAPGFRELQSWRKSGLLEAAERVLLRGRDENRSCCLRTPGGEERWLELWLARVEVDGRSMLLIAASDITPRALAERRLEESERRFRSLFDNATAGILECEPEGHILLANPRALAMLGLPPQSIQERPFPDLMHPEDAARYAPLFRDLQEGARPFECEARFQRPGGDVVWARTYVSLARDAKGKPLRLVVVMQDITGWKQAQQELEASLRRTSFLARILDESGLPFAAIYPGGVLVECNQAFQDLVGYTTDELRALGGTKVLTPPEWREIEQAHIDTLTDPSHPVRFEKEYIRKDGTRIPVELIVNMAEGPAGRPPMYYGFVSDISASKQQEARKRALEEQLQQAQKMDSLGKLAGGIAHDMNNVMGAILGLASAELEQAEAGSRQRRSMDTIVRACTRGREVVRGLLCFARQEMGVLSAVDLNQVVTDTVGLLSHTTLQRIRFATDLQSPLVPILGDAAALNHVLMNICVNAIDAMPQGGDLVLATRKLEDGRVELSVKDSGEGMPAEVLRRATEPFFTTKPAGKGTGLGLAMAYGTMQAHGGSLDLSSTPGGGTTVRLRFSASGQGAALSPEPSQAAAGLAAKALRVLLVDDDPLIRETVGALLESLGHTFTAAAGGRQALEIADSGATFDLAILDLNMPDLSGAATLPLLLQKAPGLKVLIASGYSDESLEELLAGRSGVGFIGKPFTRAELKRKIEEHMG